MNQVVISPTIKRTKVQINAAGDEIDPKTKKIIKKRDADDYVPTAEELAGMQKLPLTPPAIPTEAKGKDNPLAAAIKAQVQGLVKQQIAEVMKEIDIAGLVKDAITEAFK